MQSYLTYAERSGYHWFQESMIDCFAVGQAHKEQHYARGNHGNTSTATQVSYQADTYIQVCVTPEKSAMGVARHFYRRFVHLANAARNFA